MSAPDLWRFALRTVRPNAAAIPDGELLSRFRDTGDEAAFELLLYRHGPMVWSVCRRLLADPHAAEDAFQAVFLALARKAGTVRRAPSVAAWLHRVAFRAARHLGRTHRPALPADPTVIDPSPGPVDRAAAAELAARLDAAIDRLPERLRRVFVACELQGDPLADVAARLGCPIGTVASRLARARERLREALAVGGLSGGSLAGSAELVPPAVRQAALRAVGGIEVRPGVAELAVRASRPAGLGTVVGLAGSVAVGLMAVALAVGGPEPSHPPPKPPAKDPPPAQGPPPVAAAVRTDAEGVPLPDGAVARLGSSRFRHNGQASAVTFSSDGRLLACTHTWGVSVFEVATGRAVHRFSVPKSHFPQVARFLEDGKRLAVGTAEARTAELTVYALADGKPVATTRFDTSGKGASGKIRVIDVTADGSRVLVDDLWGKGIYLWDLKAGKEVWRFELSEVAATHPFTANGKWLAVGMKQKVELRDAATGEVVSICPAPGLGPTNLSNGALSGDGRVLVHSTEDTLAVLDLKGKAPVRTFRADRGLVRGLISPDGRYLVGLGQVVSPVWDLTAPDGRDPIARLPGAYSGGFSSDGKTLATDNDGIVTLWHTGDWKPLPQSADPPSKVFPVRFALDGRRVVGHTSAGWMCWPAAGGPAVQPAADALRHWDRDSEVSANGRVVVETVSVPGEAPGQWTVAFQITDLQTGASRRIPRTGSFMARPQLSPDGRFMVADTNYPELAVWHLTTGRVVHRRPGSLRETVLAAVPAAEGRGFAASVIAVRGEGPGIVPGLPFASVTVTDHRTGRTWNMDPPPTGGARARFSPDLSRLVLQTGSEGALGRGEVSVWDVRTGRRLMAWARPAGIRGLRNAVADPVALSAETRALLVGDGDGLLSLVEVATGQERASFRHAGGILSIDFHPDGTRAVTSGFEGPVYVWELLGNPGPWDSARADALWADLAAKDAKTAYAAVRMLRAHPAEAVAFLKDRVKVPAPPADETLARWLKDLDSPRFAVREQAQRELTSAADLIRPKLRAARKTASEEAGRRLGQVLTAAEALTAENLLQIRACEVLEGLGTPAALAVLKGWAAGPAGARLTTEAAASLGRKGP